MKIFLFTTVVLLTTVNKNMNVMVDFMNLGQHCTVRDCNQLDFLPFECHKCNGVFCLVHRTMEAHQCEHVKDNDRKAPVCPKCKQVLIVKSPTDDALQRHLKSGCTKNVSTSVKTMCSKEGCGNAEYIPFKCRACRKNYCVKHRLPSQHLCV